MSQKLLPAIAVFVEERFIRDLFCSRLSTICSTRAALPHVEVAQDFQSYVLQFLPINNNAKNSSEVVFQLLNDDGRGINNIENTAAGYRLARAADLFKNIQKLPADMLNIPASAPVDMPARFNSIFVDAQIKIDTKPLETGNYLQDMVAKLRHVDLIIKSISDFLLYPMESNAKTIYSTPTKDKFNKISSELKENLKQTSKQLTKAAKIIESYAEIPITKHEKVALQAFNDLYVKTTPDKQNKLLATSQEIAEWETFDIFWLEGNKVALRAHNHLFVQAELETDRELAATRQEIRDYEIFTIHHLTDGKVAFQANNSKFVTTRLNENNQLVADRPEVEGWESFKLTFL